MPGTHNPTFKLQADKGLNNIRDYIIYRLYYNIFDSKK